MLLPDQYRDLGPMLPYRTLDFALFFVLFLNLWFYDEAHPLPYDTHEPKSIHCNVRQQSPSIL